MFKLTLKSRFTLSRAESCLASQHFVSNQTNPKLRTKLASQIPCICPCDLRDLNSILRTR